MSISQIIAIEGDGSPKQAKWVAEQVRLVAWWDAYLAALPVCLQEDASPTERAADIAGRSVDALESFAQREIDGESKDGSE